MRTADIKVVRLGGSHSGSHSGSREPGSGGSERVRGAHPLQIEQVFFVRGLIEIPVIDTGEVFTWGVWVSLSEKNFIRASQLWNVSGRESEPPYFGWLSTELPLYSPTTIELKTNLHTRPVGERPAVELEPTAHPLAVEQGNGITNARVQEIAETLLHPGQSPE